MSSDSDDLFDMSRRIKPAVKTKKVTKLKKPSKFASAPLVRKRTNSDSDSDTQGRHSNGNHSEHRAGGSSNTPRKKPNNSSVSNVIDVDDDDIEVVGATSAVAVARAKLEAEKLLLLQARERAAAGSTLLKSPAVKRRIHDSNTSPSAANAALAVSPPSIDLLASEPDAEVTVYLFTRTGGEKPAMKLRVKVKPSQPFKAIFDDSCQRLGVHPGGMIFTFKNVELLPLSNVRALSSLKSNEPLRINGFLRDHYDELKQQAASELQRKISWLENGNGGEEGRHTNSQPHSGSSGGDGAGDFADEEASQQGPKLEILLRDSLKREMKVGVRSTTQISAIIKAFATKFGVDPSKIRIEFDHERLEPGTCVGDTEVEANDLLDVVIVK
ncbi:hypothetical protein HDU78_001907 [Chytriomyces hyalinus]|nr:hypothetical protein HDU78_001907 [Chytriomyces hyalinus]